jgi:phosphate:Na+ symporter
MSNIASLLIAGLGLFFLGLQLVGNNLQQTSSRRLRALITRVTQRAWLAGVVGVLAGGIMQSTSAVTVILASMVSSRALSVRQALPIVSWTNVGTTLLVFVAVLDLRLAVLYLLGIAGLAFTFSREASWKAWWGVLLGITLLLYGLDTMKHSAGEVQQLPWCQEMIRHVHGSYFLALASATFLAFLTQSTTAVVLIAVTLVQSGLLGPEDTMMVIYGGNLGSTFARMILTSGFKGQAKQIGHFQDLFKITGTVAFVVLFYLEVYAHIPLVRALVEWLTPSVQTQMALVNLLFNLSTAVVLSLLAGPMQQLLTYYWPATATENLAQLAYLSPAALEDPETALDLLEKEQARFIGRLPDYLGALRGALNGGKPTDLVGLHQAFLILSRELESVGSTLVAQPHAPQMSERLLNVQGRLKLMAYIEGSLNDLAITLQQLPQSPRLLRMVLNFIEGLDLLLRMAGDAAANPAGGDADVLAELCEDRGEMMGQIRKAYLSSEQELSGPDKALLYSVTTFFERTVWMVGRLAALLQQGR